MRDITYAPTATVELMSRGMECLVKAMGIVEAESFIAAIQRERFDYTKWHQEYFAHPRGKERGHLRRHQHSGSQDRPAGLLPLRPDRRGDKDYRGKVERFAES